MEGWSIAVSVITAVTAIIAIIISVTQIRVSNAQFLFEKRLNIILLIEDLMALFKSISSNIALQDRNQPAFGSDIIFTYLTNNSYLQEMVNEINEPLQNPDNHRMFLTKLEWLRAKARECLYVFKSKKYRVLSDFIKEYADFLFCIYQYRICISSTKKNDPKKPLKDSKLENKTREDYFKHYDALNDTYILLERSVLNKAKKSIKL